MNTVIVNTGEITDTKVIIGTHFLNMDEWCLGLFEMVMQSPGSRGPHRYQIFQVMRDGHVAEFQRDLGPADKWLGVEQFRIPGGVIRDDGKIEIVETVGRLVDLAEEARAGYLFNQVDKRELVGVDNIVSK